MAAYEVHSIGKISNNENGTYIEIDPKYRKGLQALEGFSHINIIWWCSDFDYEVARSTIETEKPYKTAPDKMGIFATRSPLRPNPIALTTVEIINIDSVNGIIHITYIDANNNTPLLDIKPYTPSMDRVEHPEVPDWCSHWPKSIEKSGDFAWEDEFNF